MGYARTALAGFGWQTVLKVASNVLVLIKLFVLARLLSPTDFGVFSIVLIAIGVSESVTQTGVNFTILQAKQSVEYFLDTAWVIAIIRGLGISLLMIALGFGLASFFDQSDLVYLVALAALIPAIKGFINPAIVSLHKNLAFFSDSAYRLSLVVAEMVLAIVLSFWWHSVLALIVAGIGAAVFEVMISFVFFKQRPTFAYSKNRADVIFSNAQWLSLASILTYLNENLDNLLIGRIAGTFNLGLYQNGYSLSHELNYELSKSVHHSTLPVYTRIQNDVSRLRRAFGRTTVLTLLLMAIASMPIWFFPDLVVKLLFGEQWLGMIPMVRWLVVAGWLQGATMICYTLLLARKALVAMNIHTMVVLLLMVVSVVVLGQQWGVQGAVMGVTLSRLLSMPVLMWATVKYAYLPRKTA